MPDLAQLGDDAAGDVDDAAVALLDHPFRTARVRRTGPVRLTATARAQSSGPAVAVGPAGSTVAALFTRIMRNQQNVVARSIYSGRIELVRVGNPQPVDSDRWSLILRCRAQPALSVEYERERAVAIRRHRPRPGQVPWEAAEYRPVRCGFRAVHRDRWIRLR